MPIDFSEAATEYARQVIRAERAEQRVAELETELKRLKATKSLETKSLEIGSLEKQPASS